MGSKYNCKKRNKRKGDLLNINNIDFIRAGKGIKASEIFNKIEKRIFKAKRDIDKEDSILYEDIDITR